METTIASEARLQPLYNGSEIPPAAPAPPKIQTLTGNCEPELAVGGTQMSSVRLQESSITFCLEVIGTLTNLHLSDQSPRRGEDQIGCSWQLRWLHEKYHCIQQNTV